MKKTYLIIPGNPTVASYYQSWKKEIENWNKDADVMYANSYVLFDRKLDYVAYSLAMLGHYEKLLLELKSDDKVIILGHSIGGYFALKLLEKHPEKIEKVIVMFPYIGYSTLKSLKFIRPLYLIDQVFPLVEIIAMCKNLFEK